MQVWRDHPLKSSLEKEAPLRCAELGLLQDVFAMESKQHVHVKSLASVDGQRLLAELTPSSTLELDELHSELVTVPGSEWTGLSDRAPSSTTVAHCKPSTGQIDLIPGLQACGPSRGANKWLRRASHLMQCLQCLQWGLRNRTSWVRVGLVCHLGG